MAKITDLTADGSVSGSEELPVNDAGADKKVTVTQIQAPATAHIARTDNPHSVTKAQVGLGNCDNTSDANKPVSTATQTALDAKAPAARTISAAGLATGGGDLSANRTITVPIASQAEAEAGTANDKAMTPLRTAQAIAALAGAGGTMLQGLTLRVDSINGVDATAARGDATKPYLTLAAALAAASAGDLIDVGPGTYTVTDSILKHGVNWHFAAGAVVQRTNNTNGDGILDDKGASITCRITGHGVFNMTSSADAQSGTVAARHASSVIVVECDSISMANAATLTSYNLHGCIWAGLGMVHVRCRALVGSGVSVCGVWWTDGNGHVECDTIHASYAVWLHGTTESHLHVRCNRFTPLATGDIVLYSTASDPAAALWMDGLVLGTPDNMSGSGTVQWYAGKLYLRCQKLWGGLNQAGGEVYITVDKWQAVGSVAEDASGALFALISGGTAYLTTQSFIATGFTGPAFVLTGGAATLNGGSLVCAGTTHVATVTVTSTPSSGGTFIFALLDGSTHSVWCNLDGGGGSGDISYNVTTGDDTSVIAAAIASAINTALGGSSVTASAAGNVVTLTYPKHGVVAALTESSPSSGFSFSSTTTGGTNSGVLCTGGSHLIKQLSISAPDCAYAPVRVTNGSAKVVECSLIGNGFANDAVRAAGSLYLRGCDGSDDAGVIRHVAATLLAQS